MFNRILPHRRDRMIIVPVIGAQLIMSTSLFLMPLLIDTLTTNAGISVRSAGLLLSMELAITALTTLVLSAWLRPHVAQHWAIAGGILAIAGTMLTLVSPLLAVLIVSRLIAGFGAGMVAAEATCVLARGVDRERMIGLVTIVSIFVAAFWLAVLPYMIDRLGYRAPYACLLLICVCSTLLLRGLPSPPVRVINVQMVSKSPFAWSAVLVMAAVFLTQLGQGAFWSMEEGFGSFAGFDNHTIGVILSVATLMLLFGAMGATWASIRFGQFTPLLALIAVNAISMLLVCTIANHWVYLVANIVQSLTNLSAVIYQLGLAAALDRYGRLVAVSTAMVTLGNGLGPGVSATIVAAFGVPSLGLFILTFNLLAWVLFATVAMRSRGRQQQSLQATT